MSLFDSASFFNAVYNEANSTRMTPVPVGDYIGQIQTVGPDSVSGGISDKTGKPWARLDLYIEVTGDLRIKEAYGLDKKNIRAGVMLDLTENGGLDMRKDRNIALGRLREATDLNNPNQGFGFHMFSGKMVKFHVNHTPDKRDPTIIREDVTAFFPLTATR